MKKSHILPCLIIISLMLFGFIHSKTSPSIEEQPINNKEILTKVQVELNSNVKTDSDFKFAVGSRYNSITKEKLQNLKSFDDYIGNKYAQLITSYKNVSINIFDRNDEKETSIRNRGGEFSKAQQELLRSLTYTANLSIWADYREKNQDTGIIEDSSWTHYFSVVPETQASYIKGNEAFIDYLEQYTKAETSGLENSMIKPGKLCFTVTKEGTISNVEITSTCGYPSIDNKLKNFVLTLSGEWRPAKDSNGVSVNQNLILSFGNMGC